MKKYFFADREKHLGPFSLEELKGKGLSRDTLIWFEGLEHWVKAESISELSSLFNPPPIPKSAYSSSKTETPPPKKGETKKFNAIPITASVIGILLVLIVSFTISNFTDNENGYNDSQDNPRAFSQNKTPEELKQELYLSEKNNPQKYLSVKYDLKYKILSGKDVIKGTVFNTATLTTFKDVIFTVTYKSETGTELGRSDFIAYKYIRPRSSEEFEIKLRSPKATRTIGVTVKNASAE